MFYVFRRYLVHMEWFLIDMKFISKPLSILLMEKLSFFNPHLHKIISNIYTDFHKKSETSKNIVPRTYILLKNQTILSPILTNIICVQDDSIFLAFFESILVIVRRSTGPGFHQIFEVPKTIKKVLQ